MKKSLSYIIAFVLASIFYLLASVTVNAQCPVCAIAIGGGVALSHYLGIDDIATGVWAGGLVVAFGLWMSNLIKRTFFKGQRWAIVAFLWITTVLALKQAHFIGSPTCKIHGHDKLLTGIIAGTIACLLGYFLDILLRKLNKKNPGKVFVPYQRVILPVVLLIIVTILGLRICRII